ncbi:hypothetical protein GQ607_001225 [Colletotrichum asianum]|uniref:Uncharacterized protein n=1 Tax=Colletotrichum asianum TaxID=702518 RepID=A0A8H3ZT13_9PEZI|nr:hypothetical protein GQ607_001225 [Colletotrichum asianum]
MYLERRLCHAVHAVPQYLSRRTRGRGTTTSAESVRYRLGQVPNQKTNNPPKYPLPPLHLAGPGTTGQVPPEASRQRERYGMETETGQAPARQDGQTVLSVFVQYKTTNTRNKLSTPVHVRTRPRPVSIVPVPTVQSFCVPSFTALGQAWHFDATSSRQPAHRYMLDHDDSDSLGSSCMHCSAVQYSNVSLKPGVLLVTVTA